MIRPSQQLQNTMAETRREQELQDFWRNRGGEEMRRAYEVHVQLIHGGNWKGLPSYICRCSLCRDFFKTQGLPEYGGPADVSLRNKP